MQSQKDGYWEVRKDKAAVTAGFKMKLVKYLRD